jgi:hypothetical protein
VEKFARIGIFLLIITATFLITIVQRAYSPTYSNWEIDGLRPNSWSESKQFFLAPQNLQISFSTAKQQEISLYLLDRGALEKWRQTKMLTPIIAIENASSHIAIYEIPKRDAYTILVHNPNQTPVNIEINLTLQGFEKDLLLATTVIALIGTVLIIFQRFFKK